MFDTKRYAKIAIAWTTVAYVVCYLVVMFYPPVRSAFFLYALHAEIPFTASVFTSATFIGGLVWWNVLALLSVWLWSFLYNRIK